MRRRQKKSGQLNDQLLRHVARRFLGARTWCELIQELDLKLEIDGVLCIYGASYISAGVEGSSFVWIVTGDLPPSFVFGDCFATTREVLHAYSAKLIEWADAIERSEPDMASYMPVLYRDGNREVKPTIEMARAVRMKAQAVETIIIPEI